jgi:hypothetical protein
VSSLRTLLMVLMVVRLLMPPGICVCKWTSPAARVLVALAQSERQVPNEQDWDDGDHDPGCPASPLAVGMGVRPASEPLLPPALALEALLPEMPSVIVTDHTEMVESKAFDPPTESLYLTLRTLLI